MQGVCKMKNVFKEWESTRIYLLRNEPFLYFFLDNFRVVYIDKDEFAAVSFDTLYLYRNFFKCNLWERATIIKQ